MNKHNDQLDALTYSYLFPANAMQTELTAEVYKKGDMFVVKIYEKTLKEKKRFSTYDEAVHYIQKTSLAAPHEFDVEIVPYEDGDVGGTLM